jgi:hypothetical protein
MSHDWLSSPSAAAAAPAAAGGAAAGGAAPADDASAGAAAPSFVLQTLCNVLNTVRESVPSTMVRTAGGAINRQAHLTDWGNAYSTILTRMQATGPLIHECIARIAPPVFRAMESGWKELIPRFLAEAEVFIDDLNEMSEEKFPVVVRAIESILSSCSVFKLQFPDFCTAPDGSTISLSDLTFHHIWIQGKPGVPRDPRIHTPLSDVKDRVDILIALKTMLRSAAVISASSTQLTETILDATSSFLDGRRISPDDILRITGQAQSNFNWRNFSSLAKMAGVLYASIRGESDTKARTRMLQ